MLVLAEFFLRRSNRTTVARYRPGFIERFPTAASLARADLETVLEAARWAGLRVRTASLPQTITIIMERERWTSGELLELPNIGAYAAKAIALYVFAEAVFPIDKNVLRVIGRYFESEEPCSVEATADALTGAVVASGGIGNVRSVHMGTLSIGWDYCRSRNPRCQACPLSETCVVGSKSRAATVVS